VRTAASTTLKTHRSAVTIVGAIAAVGAAAAVAGLGTLGEFTDSTAPVNTDVGTGVVSVDVSDAGSGTVPFAGGLMLAGDERTHLIDLVNSGDTDLGSVTLTAWATDSSPLDADRQRGLQLAVESCSVPWNTSGAEATCGGAEREFYAGPIIVTDKALDGATSLAAGRTDHLLLTASLPKSATGDDFEGASSSLSFVFTGTQRGGGAR
jgi:hypothetical protein